jgi:Siphovirus Gp157
MSSKLQITLEKVSEIRSLLGDADPELIHDMLEGETDVYEIIDWLLGKLGDEESMEDAIASRLTALAGRKAACSARQARVRSALHACMAATGERSMRRAEATVSLSFKKQGISQIEEAMLPDRFFRMKREVDKAAIREAMAAGEVVPGVLLDNGGDTLTVRRK